MARKNNMKTSKEKEFIVKRYLNGESATKLSNEYNVCYKSIYRWLDKYIKLGIDGLKSNTGKIKHKSENSGIHLRKPKNKIEELELEILKKDIEIEKLKKGYLVKGVGREKEFATTFKKNMK